MLARASSSRSAAATARATTTSASRTALAYPSPALARARELPADNFGATAASRRHLGAFLAEFAIYGGRFTPRAAPTLGPCPAPQGRAQWPEKMSELRGPGESPTTEALEREGVALRA